MQYNIDFNKYSQSINDLHILLVPNQRLVRKLIQSAAQSNFRKSKFQSGFNITSSFNILSISDFIDKTYSTLLETGLIKLNSNNFVLNIWHRDILFKNIIKDYIKKDLPFSDNISIDSIHAKVTQAWSLAKQWDLNWSNWRDYLQPESVLFCNFANDYTNILQNLNYSDPDDKIPDLINILDSKIIKLLNLKSIDLYGFDDLSPIYNKIFTKLNECGVPIINLDHLNSNSNINNFNNNNIKLYTATDLNNEIDIIANWAYQNVVKFETKEITEIEENIGIIVPNLGQHRIKFTKAFSEVFPNRDLWNITGGEPLSHIPIIKAALLLLELIINNKINIIDLVYLLRSEYYLKKTTIIPVQANVDNLIADIKHQGYKDLLLNDLIYYISKINLIFADSLLNNKKSLENKNNNKLPSQWALILSDILLNLGWPCGAENNINSLEYQAIMQWQAFLKELAQLDRIFGSIKLSVLFSELKALLNNSPFQI